MNKGKSSIAVSGCVLLVAGLLVTLVATASADYPAVLSPEEATLIENIVPLPTALGAYSDVDKSHGGTGGWGANYYNDNVIANGRHDPGEQFGDSNPGGWSIASDNSCWLASGCNMLEQLGKISDADALYMNYALNGVPSPGGTLTWDDGGLQEYVIQHWNNQNPGSAVTMNVHWRSVTVSYTDGMFAWKNCDPRTEVDNYLDTGWEVGIGMGPLYYDGVSGWHEGGHALTIQEIKAGNTFDCTDSDRDWDFISGVGDLNTYNDATRGPTPLGSDNYYAWYNDFYDGDILVYPVGDVGYVCAIVPEPATMSLLVLGGLALIRKRRKA